MPKDYLSPVKAALKSTASSVKCFFKKLFAVPGRIFAVWSGAGEKSPLLRPLTPHGALVTFAWRFLWFCFFTWGIFTIIKGNATDRFWGDASGYWKLSNLFVDKDGVFAFENCPTGARGYFYPFMIYCLRGFGTLFGLKDVSAYYLGFAAVLAATVIYVAPYLFGKIFNRRASIWSSWIFFIPIWIFWGTEISHPLTDIPAMCLIFVSGACFVRLLEGGTGIVAAFVCGAAAGAAYSCRQVYLIFLGSVLIGGVLAVLLTREKMYCGEAGKGPLIRLRTSFYRFRAKYGFFGAAARKLLKCALLFAGAAVVMVPQVTINEKHYDTSDWKPQTQLYTAGIKEDYPLLVFNANGLKHYARVDFYVKNGETGEIWATRYPNSGSQPDFYSYSEYFGDIFKHPGWYIKSWARSGFLGMTATYDTSYVTDMTGGFFERLVTNYLLMAVFIAAVFLLLSRKLRGRLKGGNARRTFLIWVPALGLILSGLVNCLTKMETRYLMPWYFIVYAVIAFYIFGDFRFRRETLALYGKRICRYSGAVLLIVLILLMLYIPELMDTDYLWDMLKESYLS